MGQAGGCYLAQDFSHGMDIFLPGSPRTRTALSLHGNNHIAMGSLSAGSWLGASKSKAASGSLICWVPELPRGQPRRWPQRYWHGGVGVFLPVT